MMGDRSGPPQTAAYFPTGSRLPWDQRRIPSGGRLRGCVLPAPKDATLTRVSIAPATGRRPPPGRPCLRGAGEENPCFPVKHYFPATSKVPQGPIQFMECEQKF